MATIGFIGLGNMGGPMAVNLVKAGHTVKVFDLNPQAIHKAADQGAQAMDNTADTVASTDAVITMLPKGEHSLTAYASDDGIFKHASTDTLLIDSSTIDVKSCQKLHDQAQEAGFAFVDAPVSGGISGAEAGTLTFMTGGADEHVNQARAYLDAMAGSIIPTGGPTTGQAAKICNNLMLFINLASSCEGAVLAERLGLDRQVFWNIAHVSSGQSWALDTWYPIPGIVETSGASHDYQATFRTDLADKDIGLALDAARLTETPLGLGQHVQGMFQKLIDQGWADKDCTAIVKLVEGTM